VTASFGVTVGIFVLALALSAALVVPVRALALRLGAVHRPGGRRIHEVPTPGMGGIAIVTSLLLILALAVAVTAALDLIPGESAVVLATALVLLLALGAADDLWGVPAWAKLAVEAVVVTGAVLLLLGIPRVDFGLVAVPAWLWPLSLAFTVFWVLTVTNAYNMIDGLDGLAGGVGAIAAASLAVVAHLNGAPLTTLALLAVTGALVGFLVHNRPPARIFMGDCGTLCVGFLLGLLGVLAARGEAGWAFLPVGIALGIPLADVSLAVVRRALRALAMVRGEDELRERFRLELTRPPGLFEADGGHLHHRLLHLGFSYRAAVGLLFLGAGLLGAAAVVATLFPAAAPWIALAAVAGVGFIAVSYLYSELKVFHRGLLLPLFDLPFVRSRRVHALFDFGAAAGAWLVVSALLSPAEGGPGAGEVVRNAAVAGAAMVALLRLGAVYRGAFRHVGIWQGSRMAAWSLAVGLGTAVLVQATLGSSPHPPAFVLLFAFLAATPLVAARMSFRVLDAFYQRRRRRGRKVLIYGAGRSGRMALCKILQDPGVELVPVGFIDDDPDLEGLSAEGYPVLGGVGALDEILAMVGADEVIVATGRLCSEKRTRLQEACSRWDVAVRRWLTVLQQGSETVELELVPSSGSRAVGS
jgi:UDP-GlcNAc:undecaprenyl-phosphate/decaprenyl-phosphate GlcNAc-1-phosphate transferase